MSKLKAWLWDHRGKIGAVLGAAAGAGVAGTKWQPIFEAILKVLGGGQ